MPEIDILTPQKAAEVYVPRSPHISVTYDPAGNITATVENGVVTTYAYDAAGRVQSETRNGVVRTFTYDAAGRLTGADS
jgi:YD repeat-containing protein